MASKRKMTGGKMDSEAVKIPIEAIFCDYGFNARPFESYAGTKEGKDGEERVVYSAEIKALADDIRTHGQIAPVVIWRPTPAMPKEIQKEIKEAACQGMLIAGFRRYAACEFAKVEILTIGFEGTEAEARLINLKENVAREDLPLSALATQYHRLHTQDGLSMSEIAAYLAETQGCATEGASGGTTHSKGYITNLVKIREDAGESIWHRFEMEAEGATVMNCRNVAAKYPKDDAAQVKYWNEVVAGDIASRRIPAAGENTEPNPDEPPTENPGRKAKRKPGKTSVADALANLKASRNTSDYHAGAYAALRWIVGEVQSIRVTEGKTVLAVVFDPRNVGQEENGEE